MADEKNEDQTPGSDPSSPRDPDAVTPEDAAGSASDPTPADEAEPEGPAEPAAPADAAGDGQTPDSPDEQIDEKFHEQVGEESAEEAEQRRAEAESDLAEQPALVGAAASRRPVRRESGESTTEAKGRATRRRGADEADGGTERTGPVTFVNESVGELRKVVWPTSEMMRTYFVVVLVFVLFMITVVSLLDLLFGWALLQVFR